MAGHARTTWALVLCLAVSSTACGSRRGGGGGGDDDDDSVSNDDRQAAQDFMDGYPAAFCGWAVDCGFVEAGAQQGCIDDITDEIADVELCDAMVQQYVANRTALEACLNGEGGACGENDDAFCPALAAVDYKHACDTPECTGPGQCPDGQECVDGTCTGGGGGDLTTEQAVVGAWSWAGTCGELEFNPWVMFICPGGRVRGGQTINGYDYVLCGTWSVAGDRVSTSWTQIPVADPTYTADYDFDYDYSSTTDLLTWDSNCPIPFERAVGQVTEEDCTGGACDRGGTGDVGCGTDCDCGRCWYCESGTCRYAGEGPYGCYRGCGL